MKKFFKGLKEYFMKHKLVGSVAIIFIAGAIIYATTGAEINLKRATDLFCKIVHCEEQNTVEVIDAE